MTWLLIMSIFPTMVKKNDGDTIKTKPKQGTSRLCLCFHIHNIKK
jgi:hypothetical protein